MLFSVEVLRVHSLGQPERVAPVSLTSSFIDQAVGWVYLAIIPILPLNIL